jgi:hypothetical protein
MFPERGCERDLDVRRADRLDELDELEGLGLVVVVAVDLA